MENNHYFTENSADKLRIVNGVLGRVGHVFIHALCPKSHIFCNSQDFEMREMTMKDFRETIALLVALSYERVEIHAKDVLSHVYIFEMIALLNISGLKYTLRLASPTSKEMMGLLQRALMDIDPGIGKILFSVKYSASLAQRILLKGERHPLFKKAQESFAFWEQSKLLANSHIPTLVEIYLSGSNAFDVPYVVVDTAKIGASALIRMTREFSGAALTEYQDFLRETGLLSPSKISAIVNFNKMTVEGNRFLPSGIFENAKIKTSPSRGLLVAVVDILVQMKKHLVISRHMAQSENAIRQLTQPPRGCIHLMKCRHYPNISVLPGENLKLCPYLTAPWILKHTLRTFLSTSQTAQFLADAENSTQIYLCNHFCPCYGKL